MKVALKTCSFSPSSMAWRRTSGPLLCRRSCRRSTSLNHCPGSAMHDLGEIAESRFSQLQQLLTLQIALASLARYRCHHRRTMHRKRGPLVGNELPRVHHFVPARYDAQPTGIQIQRPGMLIASGGMEYG